MNAHEPTSPFLGEDDEKIGTGRACGTPGCSSPTSGRRPYCDEHLDESPYVREVKGRIAIHEAEVEQAKKGVLDEVVKKDLLVPIWVHGGRTAREVAREAGIDPSVAERCLDTLESEGIVESFLLRPRKIGNRPKRTRKVLVLTELGEEVIDKRIEPSRPPKIEKAVGRIIAADICPKCFLTCMPNMTGLCRACRGLPTLRVDEPFEPVLENRVLFSGELVAVTRRPSPTRLDPPDADRPDPQHKASPLAPASRRELAKRLLHGRENGARSGKHQSGPAPFGYRRDADRSIKINEQEAEVVRFIFNEYLRVRSMKRLIELLAERSWRTRRGKAWSRAGISWILRNDTYVGRVHFGDIHTAGRHDPIVSQIIFNKARRLIRENDKRTRAMATPSPSLESPTPIVAPVPVVAPTASAASAVDPSEWVDLIWKVAKGIAFKAEIEAGELVAWGWDGLVAAARTFDPTKGASFKTHATRRISGAIIDGFRQETGWRRKSRHNASTITLSALGENSDAWHPATRPSDETPEKIEELRRALENLSTRTRAALLADGRGRNSTGVSLRVEAERFGVSESRMCQLRRDGIEHLREELGAPKPTPEPTPEPTPIASMPKPTPIAPAPEPTVSPGVAEGHVTCQSHSSEPEGMIVAEGGRDMAGTIFPVKAKKSPSATKTRIAIKFDELHEQLKQAISDIKESLDTVALAVKTIRKEMLDGIDGEDVVELTPRNGAVKASKPKTKKAPKAKKDPVAFTKREPPAVAPGGVFSEWLKKVRATSELSQPEFGEKVGASRTQMWHWEKGSMAPGESALKRIETFSRETCPAR